MDSIRQAALVLQCRSCSKEGDTALLKLCSACGAARYCSKECQEADFKKHKRMCTLNGMITLMDAINRNDADMVRKMACTKRILNGVCPPSMGRFQETALHHCVAKNNAAMMAILLEQNGVNVDIVDSDHETPLCFAATIWGTAELVRLLLEAGADPNAERGFGWYPLKLSLTTGDCDITKALLDHPATIVDMSELERLMDKQTRGCNINYLDDETGEQAIARCVKVHELVRSYSK